MPQDVLWALLAVAAANLILLAWMLVRRAGQAELLALQSAQAQSTVAIKAVAERIERMERDLGRVIDESSRGARQELTQTFALFQQTLLKQGAEDTRTQNTQIDAFGQQLALLKQTLSDTLVGQLQGMSESNARRMLEVRQTLEAQLAQLQATNSVKLDEMRATVDEKLQAT